MSNWIVYNARGYKIGPSLSEAAARRVVTRLGSKYKTIEIVDGEYDAWLMLAQELDALG